MSKIPDPPKPEEFSTQEEYEEAKGFWGSRFGQFFRKTPGVSRPAPSEESATASPSGSAPTPTSKAPE